MEAMSKLKRAFKADERYNPCKAFPTHRGCGEVSHARVQQAATQIGADVYV
jgi:hypothetical protein